MNVHSFDRKKTTAAITAAQKPKTTNKKKERRSIKKKWTHTRKTSKRENTQERRLNRSKAAAAAAKYTNRARESSSRYNALHSIYVHTHIQHDPIWWWWRWWRRRERLLCTHKKIGFFFCCRLFVIQLLYCCIFSHIRRFSRAVLCSARPFKLCVCSLCCFSWIWTWAVGSAWNGMDFERTNKRNEWMYRVADIF